MDTHPGLQVRDLRRARGWSKRELARRSECDISTITRLEKALGEPHDYILSRIARAFEEEPDYFFKKQSA